MKRIRHYIVFAALFLFGAISFALYMQEYEPSLTILSLEHNGSSLKNTPMLAGKKLTFEIAAPHNGLGIIAIRFNTYRRINNDVLAFRLKPKGSLSWTYSNNYNTDQFQDHKLFPFGFPTDQFSKKRTYLVQLESVSGTENNHVSIDTSFPVLVSKYQFRPSTHLSFTTENTRFILEKILSILTNISSIFPILVYFSPLIIFLINSPTAIVIPITTASAIYLLHLPEPTHWVLSIILAWLTFLLTNKVSYRISIVLSLIASFFLVIQLQRSHAGTEEGAMWLYLFLLMTIIQIKAIAFQNN